MSRLPARTREALAGLAAAGADGFDLAAAALSLAAVHRPRLDLEPYLRHIDGLAEEAAAYAGPLPKCSLAADALRQVIALRYGYGVGDSDAVEPEECDLARVIDSRAGTAEALVLLYLAVADRLEWPARGVDFPPRPMVRLSWAGDRVMLDPVDRGRLVGAEYLRALLKADAGIEAELTPQHHRDMDRLAVLLRLQRGAKLRYLRQERLAEALTTVEATLAIDPDSAHLWREAGLLNARLDDVPAAVAALEEYLRRGGGGVQRQRATALLQELRGRLS